jgi:hypothetical protein
MRRINKLIKRYGEPSRKGATDDLDEKYTAEAMKYLDEQGNKGTQPPYQVWKPSIAIGTKIQFLDNNREKTWRGIVSDMIPSREETIYCVEEAVSDAGEEAGCFPWIKNKDSIKVL